MSLNLSRERHEILSREIVEWNYEKNSQSMAWAIAVIRVVIFIGVNWIPNNRRVGLE